MAIIPGLPRTFAVNNPQLLESLKDIDFSDMNAGYGAGQLWSLTYDPLNPCKTFSFQQVCGAPCSGGSFACIDITRAQALTLISTSGFSPCSFYRITDRGNIILRARSTSRLEKHGNADAPANPFTTNELIFMIYDIVTDLVSYVEDLRGNKYTYNVLSFGGVTGLLTSAQYGNPNIIQNTYNQTSINYSGVSSARIQYCDFGSGSITISDNAWLFNARLNADFVFAAVDNSIFYASELVASTLSMSEDSLIQNSRLHSSDVVILTTDQLIGCSIEGQKTRILTFADGIQHNSKSIYPGLSDFEITLNMTGGTQLDMSAHLWAGIVNTINNDLIPTLDTVVFNNENHDLTVRMATGVPMAVNVVAIGLALANELVFTGAGVFTLTGGNGDELTLFRKSSNAYNYIRSLQNFG